MGSRSLVTCFAPAGRQPAAVVEAEARRLPSGDLVRWLLDAFPQPAVLLTNDRQVCVANARFTQWLGCSASDLVGSRPGEAVSCVNAWREESGCGTSLFCRNCGAVRAILDSQWNCQPAMRECRILAERHGTMVSYDLRVWATPLVLDGASYTVFAIEDITDEKRLCVLERAFFHEVLDLAGGIAGVLDSWDGAAGKDSRGMRDMARRLTDDLVEAIRAQRDLALAERGELPVAAEDVDVGLFLERLRDAWQEQPLALGKRVIAPGPTAATVLRTDPRLLARVLGSLLRNALEASEAGDTVTIGYDAELSTFTVHNRGFMAERAQQQVFQRSFSTKPDRGHGVGCYGAKLITERHLGGTVRFHSAAGAGTTFFVALPADRPPVRHGT